MCVEKGTGYIIGFGGAWHFRRCGWGKSVCGLSNRLLFWAIVGQFELSSGVLDNSLSVCGVVRWGEFFPRRLIAYAFHSKLLAPDEPSFSISSVNLFTIVLSNFCS